MSSSSASWGYRLGREGEGTAEPASLSGTGPGAQGPPVVPTLDSAPGVASGAERWSSAPGTLHAMGRWPLKERRRGDVGRWAARGREQAGRERELEVPVATRGRSTHGP